jgi:hypothetical protein
VKRVRRARGHPHIIGPSERLGSRAGLWGSLVHPSGFGTPRRQFKSGQSHCADPGLPEAVAAKEL